jgi:ABC-2 type transport system ATP-binding protein
MLDLIRKIGKDFGIAVFVTSHLLGELERISDHLVVLDGGRLLQSCATSELTLATGLLLIEVAGPGDAQDRMGQALAAAGVHARPRGRLIEVEAGDDRVHDVIRDVAADLELGLVRLQDGHHHIEDVFREGGAGHVRPV